MLVREIAIAIARAYAQKEAYIADLESRLERERALYEVYSAEVSKNKAALKLADELAGDLTAMPDGIWCWLKDKARRYQEARKP